MLRESPHENLKILIAPLIIKSSSLKSTETVSTVVSYGGLVICISQQKSIVMFYDLKKQIQLYNTLNRPRTNIVFFAIIGYISFCVTKKNTTATTFLPPTHYPYV